jgi:hypothetical protein
MRQGEGLRVLCKWRRRRRRRRWRMLLLLLLMCYMMMMTLADLCGRQMRVRVLMFWSMRHVWGTRSTRGFVVDRYALRFGMHEEGRVRKPAICTHTCKDTHICMHTCEDTQAEA